MAKVAVYLRKIGNIEKIEYDKIMVDHIIEKASQLDLLLSNPRYHEEGWNEACEMLLWNISDFLKEYGLEDQCQVNMNQYTVRECLEVLSIQKALSYSRYNREKEVSLVGKIKG